ncbi:MAG: metallophosphoesterase [Hyphomonadaceae bacterium]|nr:metallophosphoesterase [Hyphomonadaceae bacterium]
MPITIAHLTDVHLGPVEGFGPRYWSVKRAAGYYNWMRHRRLDHQRGVLDRLLADLAAQRPDHIVVTGDLVNIGLPQEHINALAWLEALGPPGRVSVIPGNHDIYAPIGRDPGTRRWAAYMASDAEGAAFVREASDFPFVRVLGGVALIGVNSAVPTPPLMAWGRVGEDQLARLAAALDALGQARLFRLVLIHHPPLSGQASYVRGLKDAAALQAVLTRHGAELVIHGHNHRSMLAWADGPSGRFPVVGTPSASLGRRHRHEPLGRYNLLRIDAARRRVDLMGRGLAEPSGAVVELERRILAPKA